MMRCHQYCGGATDLVHRQNNGDPGSAKKMLVPICDRFVCVFEACDGICDCRDFEENRRMKLILLFGKSTPGARRCGRIQRMRVG